MEHFISNYGYIALLILTIAEGACVPIPSEVTIGSAAFLASTGKLDLAAVIILGIVGEVIGCAVGYVIGRFGGRLAVEKYGKFILLSGRDLDRSEAWFGKRGEVGVLIGRMVPLVRTFVALAAGTAEMAFGRFMIFTTIGTAIWITLIGFITDSLGKNYTKLTKGFGYAGYIVALLVVIMVGVFLYHRWKSFHEETQAG